MVYTKTNSESALARQELWGTETVAHVHHKVNSCKRDVGVKAV